MQNTVIGDNVIMDNVISDKGIVISNDNIIRGEGSLPITIEKEKAIF